MNLTKEEKVILARHCDGLYAKSPVIGILTKVINAKKEGSSEQLSMASLNLQHRDVTLTDGGVAAFADQVDQKANKALSSLKYIAKDPELKYLLFNLKFGIVGISLAETEGLLFLKYQCQLTGYLPIYNFLARDIVLLDKK